MNLTWAHHPRPLWCPGQSLCEVAWKAFVQHSPRNSGPQKQILVNLQSLREKHLQRPSAYAQNDLLWYLLAPHPKNSCRRCRSLGVRDLKSWGRLWDQLSAESCGSPTTDTPWTKQIKGFEVMTHHPQARRRWYDRKTSSDRLIPVNSATSHQLKFFQGETGGVSLNTLHKKTFGTDTKFGPSGQVPSHGQRARRKLPQTPCGWQPQSAVTGKIPKSWHKDYVSRESSKCRPKIV